MDDTASAPKPATPHDRMLACLGMAGLTPTERIVLAAIAYHDGPGGAFPSQSTIAAALGLSGHRVRELIAGVVDKGVLVSVKRRRTSRYRIAYGFRPAEIPPVRTIPKTGGNPALDWRKPRHKTGGNSASKQEGTGSLNEVQGFPVLEGGSASAREPTVDAGAPPSRAHVAADEPKSEKPPALPSPERFAKQQEFDALRAGLAERRKAEAQAHCARMIVEADAQWASDIAKAAGAGGQPED